MSSAREDDALDEEDIEAALRALGSRDRVGRTGELLATGGGAAAGAVAAGTVAGAAGASTFLGSTTLGSLVGGALVVSTPVGWVIGCAAVGGLAAFAVARLIRSGARQDEVRSRLKERMEQRLRKSGYPTREERNAMEQALSDGLMTADQAARMASLVDAGAMDHELAAARVNALLQARGPGKAQSSAE